MHDFKIYQSPEFLSILEDVYQIEKVSVFDDETLSHLTTFYRSKKKKGDIFNMPFNFYYSPNIPQERENEYFEKLHNFSQEKNKNVIIKSLKKYEQPFICQNFNSILSTEEHKDYDSYFLSLRKNFRKNIKTIQNNLPSDIELKVLSTIEEVDSFYICLSNLYVKKHKMVFQPINLYRELFQKGIAKIFAYKKRNKVVAAIVIIEDGEHVHYNWGVTDTEYYKYSLNTLLVNEMIKHYIDKGTVRHFDFGATPAGDENLLYFKSRWNATHYPVYEYYTLREPARIDLNNSYQLARNVYSYFPKPFLRWLMPRVIPWLVQ